MTGIHFTKEVAENPFTGTDPQSKQITEKLWGFALFVA
jgi:hypothetical protein